MNKSILFIVISVVLSSCSFAPNSKLEVVDKGTSYVVLKGHIDKIPARQSLSVVYSPHNSNLSFTSDKVSVYPNTNDFIIRIGGLCPDKSYYFGLMTFFSIREYTIGSQRLLVHTDKISSESPQAIDLGLSVLWANCNIGAKQETDAGVYYSWGYPKEEVNHDHFERYHTFVDDLGGISGTKYDPATNTYGDGWRLPTEKEIKELYAKCEWEWSEQTGGYGFYVKAPNGNAIFLPAGGYVHKTTLKEYDIKGCYLLDKRYSNSLSFSKNDKEIALQKYCESGYTVRPVKNK